MRCLRNTWSPPVFLVRGRQTLCQKRTHGPFQSQLSLRGTQEAIYVTLLLIGPKEACYRSTWSRQCSAMCCAVCSTCMRMDGRTWMCLRRIFCSTTLMAALAVAKECPAAEFRRC